LAERTGVGVDTSIGEKPIPTHAQFKTQKIRVSVSRQIVCPHVSRVENQVRLGVPMNVVVPDPTGVSPRGGLGNRNALGGPSHQRQVESAVPKQRSTTVRMTKPIDHPFQSLGPSSPSVPPGRVSLLNPIPQFRQGFRQFKLVHGGSF
jgi:hypothetical protein